MNKALIIIGIQEDYFKEGACELTNSLDISLKAKKLMDFFRTNSLPIFHIQHSNAIRPEATSLLPETRGINIHKNVEPIMGEIVIEKNFPNSFLQTNLESSLENLNIQELVLCGMMTHLCIDATTRAAFDLGFNCMLAHDACTSKDMNFQDNTVKHKDVHNAFISALAGYAELLSADEIVQTLELES